MLRVRRVARGAGADLQGFDRDVRPRARAGRAAVRDAARRFFRPRWSDVSSHGRYKAKSADYYEKGDVPDRVEIDPVPDCLKELFDKEPPYPMPKLY